MKNKLKGEYIKLIESYKYHSSYDIVDEIWCISEKRMIEVFKDMDCINE